MAVHTFVVPTRVLSGPSAVAEIGPTLSAEGHKSILIVTDEGIVNAAASFRSHVHCKVLM